MVTESLNLGFTFSFPMIQERLDAARLVSWTKSFNCPGVEGEEVVGLLQKAINDKSLNVRTITKRSMIKLMFVITRSRSW